MGKPLILEVALPTPLRKTFDYILPQHLNTETLKPGCRVKVPFGHSRQRIALLVNFKEQTDVPNNKLKYINDIIDEVPLFKQTEIEFIIWASRYYHHPIGEVIFNAMPPSLRRGQSAEPVKEIIWNANPTKESITRLLHRAPKQCALYQLIRSNPQGIRESSLKEMGTFDSRVLQSLCKKQLVRSQYLSPNETLNPLTAITKPSRLNLTQEQAAVVKNLSSKLFQFHSHLLFGVTGSGKTEVYLQIIQRVLEQAAQTLFLVPEIGLIPQLLHSLQQRFTVKIYLSHSNMTATERLETFLAARNGHAQIILGTRSAIWLPLIKPGLIIIDEEHDPSYKQQEGFRYSAKDLALVRAKKQKFPVLLGSATPSMESLANGLHGQFNLHYLNQRISNTPTPPVTVIDTRALKMQGSLSPQLIKKIEYTLQHGQQVLLFLNRRGYAPALICHHCGWGAICDRCDTHMTYHRSLSRLWCHHCERQIQKPSHCPECNHTDLREVGHGTERIEEELLTLFPAHIIQRIDRDSTRKKGSLNNYLETINSGKPCIMIGTQMLSKGHHFPNVTLVGIIDVDSSLYSNDFRANERLAQQLEQVSGRAGRGKAVGSVLLQTHHPDNPMLTSMLKSGYKSFSKLVLEERHEMELPPYRYYAMLRAESHTPISTQHFLSQAKQCFSCSSKRLKITEPLTSPIERRRGRYRMHLLIHSDSRGILNRALTDWILKLEHLVEGRYVKWSIDVDPQEMI